MTLETDLLLDRRRLKRRLFFWRSFAVLAVLAAVLVALRGARVGVERAHVARLTVNGIITENRKLTRRSTSWRTTTSVKALIVAIDSPGGSVAGGESLHDAIADVAAKKPVVAVMGGLAASAGYMIAVPADPHFRPRGDAHRLDRRAAGNRRGSRAAGKLGIDRQTIVSGPLKDQPSFTEAAVAARAAGAAGAGDGHVRPVRRHGRGRPPHGPGARCASLADGRAYTGRQALKLGLVDADRRRARTRARGWPRPRACRPTCRSMTSADRKPGRADAARALWGRSSTAFGKPCFPKELCLTAHGPSGSVPATELQQAGNRGNGVTKSELIAELAAPTRICAAADVELIVATIFDEITAALSRGERVELRGFGAFTVKRRDARTGRNPAHGRGGAGGREGGAVLQGRQGAARAGQPWPQRVSGRRWGGAAKLILAASARRCASGPLSHQLFPNARVLVRPQVLSLLARNRNSPPLVGPLWEG